VSTLDVDYGTMRSWLAEVRYKPGWEFEVFAVPGQPWHDPPPYLRCTIATIDSATGEPATIVHTMPMRLRPGDGRDAFHREVLWAVVDVETHEAMEFFALPEGRLIDPHPEPTVALYHLP
jgi:hypothetical protein